MLSGHQLLKRVTGPSLSAGQARAKASVTASAERNGDRQPRLSKKQDRRGLAGGEMSSAGLRTRSPTRTPYARAQEDAEGSTHSDEKEGMIEPMDVESAPLVGGKRLPGLRRKQPVSREEEQVDWVMTSLVFLFPALGGLLFGYNIGATSGALVSIMSPEFSGTDWYQLSALQSGLVVSLSLAGALLGSAAALVYGDKIGRRRELLAAAALYAVASGVLAVAPGLTTVLLGQLLYGTGIGFAMHAAPAYIAETSPAGVRGLLISLKEAFIVGGILAGYATSYLFVETVGGWRWMFGLAALPALLLGLGMAWLPESPRWLLLSGAGSSAALDALRRAKGRAANEAEVREEVGQMEASIAASPMAQSSGPFDFSDLLQPRNQRPLQIGLSLMLFQQITGQPSVLYYAATIFQAAGFAEASEATRVSLILGLFKLVMTGIAVAKVDSWGRRPLLLYGVSGIVLSLLALGAASSSDGGAALLSLPPDVLAWTNLLALLVYVGCYQLSFGPISWLIVGEVFPLKVRGQAIALATLTNFGSNFLVSLFFPTLRQAVGPSATYFAFAAIGVVAVASIYSSVPETKGKTLEEIEALWQEGSSSSNGNGGRAVELGAGSRGGREEHDE